MKVLDVLTDESRWTKRIFGSNGSPRCLSGALAEAYGYTNSNESIQLAEAIKLLFPERIYCGSPEYSIVCFNDHENTTFEDVQRVAKFADV